MRGADAARALFDEAGDGERGEQLVEAVDLREQRAEAALIGRVAEHRERLERAARVDREPLDAEGDEVGHARGRVAPALDVEADELVDVERRHRRDRRFAAAFPVDRELRVGAAHGPGRARSAERALAVDDRDALDERRGDRGGQAAERVLEAAPVRLEAGRVRRDDEHGRERRLGDHVGEGGAARSVDGVEVVDREDDPVAAGVLVRARHGPAQALGGDEAAVFGREAARGGARPEVALRGVAVADGEEVRQAAAGLGGGARPVGGAAAVRRETRELDDRAAERVVADLGPPGVGAGLHDDVARGGREAQELLQKTGFPDAVVADDADRGERSVHVLATRLEPLEVVLAGREGDGEAREAGEALAAAVAHGRDRAARRGRARQRDARAAVAAELLPARDDGAARRADDAGLGRGEAARRAVGRDHRSAERRGELVGALEAADRVFLERLHRDLDEALGDVALGGDHARIRRRQREVHEHHLRGRVGLEREAAREQLEEDHADGVEIAAGVDRIAAALLGRHVVGGAADDARARDVGRADLGLHLREAEVDDLHEVAAGPHGLDDDVLGLQIAVNDVEVVGLGEGGEHLAEDVDDALEGERPLFVDDAGQVFPAEELHDQVELRAALAEVDHADRVRVIEAAGGAGLGDEADRRALVAEEVRVDDLHRDRASEGLLLGPIDAAHTADADELEDPVAPGERGADQSVIAPTVELCDREAANRAKLVRGGAQVAALRAHDIRHGEHPLTGRNGLAGPLPRSAFNIVQGWAGRLRGGIYQLECRPSAWPRVGLPSAAHGHPSTASRAAPRRRQAHH